ncbi:hypothetical protein [Halocatena pleomorpha]|uniref:Uncharacterized protein n=1 Tax=Halocatena pleomorpha TaxID=1785090 RepID=A0A3P3RLQ0_9EURY|nr:hypothetical protein [Halocatena pleomorpha]RRJ33828.1 hypothetical protein EIK79_03325 [Halocatena pleomorpha]
MRVPDSARTAPRMKPSFPLPEAASLILVLTGGLLAAFGGFTIVLPIDDVERKSIGLFVMGTLLSGVGMTVVLQL